MKLNLVTVPDEFLREKSRPLEIDEITTPEMQELIESMKTSMKVENGVGLAAPQIGKHIRLIVAETKQGPQAFINPEITKRSLRKMKSEEGCLSIPGVVGVVDRHRTVDVKALDQNGEVVTMQNVDSLLSVIFQHEIDHLDGILFIDRAKKVYHAKGDVLV